MHAQVSKTLCSVWTYMAWTMYHNQHTGHVTAVLIMYSTFYICRSSTAAHIVNLNQSESENVIFLPQKPSIDEDCSFCLFLAAQEGWSSWLSGRVTMLAPPPGWWAIDQNAGTCIRTLHIQCIMYIGMYWYIHHACNNKYTCTVYTHTYVRTCS